MNTDVFLIRHGEPVLQNALLGLTDSPLSDKGWQQLNDRFAQLSSIDRLHCSSLSRCAAFGQEICEQNNWPLSIDDNWRECHFGQWDGLTYQQALQMDRERVGLFFSDPAKHTPPQGESLAQFWQRIETAWMRLLDQSKGQRIVLLSHAGVIRNLVGWCLNMNLESGLQFRRFDLDYASITHISVFTDEQGNHFPQLKQLNGSCLGHD